jgi:transposase InsO family protein
MNAQLQFFFLMVAGWVNRQQQAVIEYLQEENRILLEQLGGEPKRFTDAQRIRLARKAKVVGRRRLLALSTVVTPDTLLRWFRVLVARKWTYAKRTAPGRPAVEPEVEKLVVKLMMDNPNWGSDRIIGVLANLHYTISDSTVDNIRKRHGIAPAPERGKNTTWRQFLKAHWEGLIAADFFTTEVLCWNGLITFYTLFVIELRSRVVHVCGTTATPDGQWMKQGARPLTDGMDGFACGKTHLIIDRDTKYGQGFRQILEGAGVNIVLCPPRAPQCNAIAERFVRSIKEECLSRLICFGEVHLRSAISHFVAHYNRQRNHQGRENKLLTPQFLPIEGQIACEKRLGGMLNYYYRKAA